MIKTKEKTIIEGNELIAKFCEWKIIAHRCYHGPIHQHVGSQFLTGANWETKMTHIERLQFHTSWDWLMPVVEKISTLQYPDFYSKGYEGERTPFEDYAYPRTFGMRDSNGDYMVRINANSLITAPTFKEAVWEAVVDFIKWQNELNPRTMPTPTCPICNGEGEVEKNFPATETRLEFDAPVTCSECNGSGEIVSIKDYEPPSGQSKDYPVRK